MGLSSTGEELERGRESYARSAWATAYESLARVDELEPLAVQDLELLAISTYMLGREDEWLQLMERACRECAGAGEQRLAARCAFWIGMHLFLRGEMGPGTGWLGRAGRLLDGEGECVERGYMLMPVAFQHEAEGDYDGAAATAAAAVELGEQFGDQDLFSLATFGQGDILVRHGRVREGLVLLDEAMVGATTGELSPIVTGIVYCGVIMACEEVYDVRRAREWTAALRRWWEQQPDLMAFTGRCLVHRAQLMHLQGAWPEALEETDRANRRFEKSMNQDAAAKAAYLQGEVNRLRGDFAAAEEAYRRASQLGLEPQPGWSLLRLAQGKADAAAAAIRRVVGETTDSLRRGGLLPAYVEIMLRIGELEEARDGSQELEQIAAECDSDLLRACAAQALGAVDLAAGDATRALASLREAAQAWQELDAPYEVRVPECSSGGRAARSATTRPSSSSSSRPGAPSSSWERRRTSPRPARCDGREAETHGLTSRELEVLRLIASGKSNREIASALVISEHTVARHVQNIFAKLRVTSRTAAGAFAFEHDLV